MGLTDILKSFLDSEEEEAKIDVDEAAEFFRDRKEENLNQIEDKQKDLMKKTDEIVNSLNESLELVKSFDDNEDLDIVEDVAESFYNKRKNMLEDFDLSENIEDHVDDFSDFVERFNDVSRKEGAVLNRIQKQDGSLQSSIESMVKHREDLEEFIEEERHMFLRVKEIEKDLEDIEKLREDIEAAKGKINDLEKSKKETKKTVSEKKEELQALKDSEEMDRLEKIDKEIVDLKSKKDRIRSSLNQDVSLIERGLKKAKYEIENRDASFSGDLNEIKQLKDKNYQKAVPVDGLEELRDLIDSESLLDDEQFDKFEKGVKKLSDLEERVSRIEDISDEIKSLEGEKESLDVIEGRERLEEDIEELQDDIKEINEELEELKHRREGLKDDLEEKITAMEKGLNSHLNVDISLEGETISRTES